METTRNLPYCAPEDQASQEANVRNNSEVIVSSLDIQTRSGSGTGSGNRLVLPQLLTVKQRKNRL
jgi:hypothetical protein